VELFLNGRSLGEKSREFPAQGTSGGWNSYALPEVRATTGDLHLSWDVPYQPGVLRAVGKRRDGTVACQAELRSTGPATAIRLSVDRDTIAADPADAAHVIVEIVDSAGTVVPTAHTHVRYTLAGGGNLALDNADLQDLDPYRSDQRMTFNGRGLAVLRALQSGILTLTASADGLRPATVRVQVVAGPARSVIPPAR
jgi:beta-galactosidase